MEQDDMEIKRCGFREMGNAIGGTERYWNNEI